MIIFWLFRAKPFLPTNYEWEVSLDVHKMGRSGRLKIEYILIEVLKNIFNSGRILETGLNVFYS